MEVPLTRWGRGEIAMSKQTKLIAGIGGVLIIAAGIFFMVSSKPPAEQAAQRGFVAH